MTRPMLIAAYTRKKKTDATLLIECEIACVETPGRISSSAVTVSIVVTLGFPSLVRTCMI